MYPVFYPSEIRSALKKKASMCIGLYRNTASVRHRPNPPAGKSGEARLSGDSPVLFPRHRERHLVPGVDLIIEPRGQMVAVCVRALSRGAVGAILRPEPLEAAGVQTVRSIADRSALIVVRRRHSRQIILRDQPDWIDSRAVRVLHIAEKLNERTAQDSGVAVYRPKASSNSRRHYGGLVE